MGAAQYQRIFVSTLKPTKGSQRGLGQIMVKDKFNETTP